MKGNRLRRLPAHYERGAITKRRLLEVAKQLFAENGYDGTESREITRQAGVNVASVNLYFGGIDGIYGEVLREAHEWLQNHGRLKVGVDAPAASSERLAYLIDTLSLIVLEDPSSNWALRVICRELFWPSSFSEGLVERDIRPWRSALVEVVADMLGVSREHPAVASCCLAIVAPFALLVLGNEDIRSEASSRSKGKVARLEYRVAHFQQLVSGGLSAVSQSLSKRKKR